jgi:hypothetical protein
LYRHNDNKEKRLTNMSAADEEEPTSSLHLLESSYPNRSTRVDHPESFDVEEDESFLSTIRDLLSRAAEINETCEAIDIDTESSPFSQARWKPQRRVVAFSDIHGDFQVLVQTLRDCAQVIDVDAKTGKCTWIGRDTFVVIVGDMVDRFRPGLTVLDPETGLGDGEGLHDETNILLLLNDLAAQALAAGGRVIKCLGNHEVMNMSGQFGSVTPRLLENGRRLREWAKDDQGRLGHMRQATWDCGAYTVVQIGPWVFCHGGITKAITDYVRQEQRRSHEVEAKHRQLPLIDFIHQAITRQFDAKNDGSRRVQQSPLTRKVYESGRMGPSILWNARASERDWLDEETCKDILNDLSTLGDNATVKKEGPLMAPQFLVVGHSQQKERDAGEFGWAQVRRVDGRQEESQRNVYVFDAKATYSASVAAAKRATRELHQRAGARQKDKVAINGVCGDASTGGIPRVWRVDAAISRSFSRGHKSDDVEYPHAQALEILFDESTQKYLAPRLLVSTRARSTEFVRQHAHHRHHGYGHGGQHDH